MYEGRRMRDERWLMHFHPVRFNLLLIAVILSISLTFIYGCRSGVSQDKGAPAEINVAAAANLTEAFDELGREFTARTGIRAPGLPTPLQFFTNVSTLKSFPSVLMVIVPLLPVMRICAPDAFQRSTTSLCGWPKIEFKPTEMIA